MIEALRNRITKSGHALAPFMLSFLYGVEDFQDMELAVDMMSAESYRYRGWIDSKTVFSEDLDEELSYPLDWELLEQKEKALLFLQVELIKIIEDEVFKK